MDNGAFHFKTAEVGLVLGSSAYQNSWRFWFETSGWIGSKNKESSTLCGIGVGPGSTDGFDGAPGENSFYHMSIWNAEYPWTVTDLYNPTKPDEVCNQDIKAPFAPPTVKTWSLRVAGASNFSGDKIKLKAGDSYCGPGFPTKINNVNINHRLTMMDNKGVPGAPENGTYWYLSHGWGPLELPALKLIGDDRSNMMNEGYVFEYDTIPANTTDITPPAPVNSFVASSGVGQITLSWTNPTDADFTGTIIRFKTTGYPVGPMDGTMLTHVFSLPGSSNIYVHTGLTIGQTYYYSAFSHDGVRNYAAAAQVSTATIIERWRFRFETIGWIGSKKKEGSTLCTIGVEPGATDGFDGEPPESYAHMSWWGAEYPWTVTDLYDPAKANQVCIQDIKSPFAPPTVKTWSLRVAGAKKFSGGKIKLRAWECDGYPGFPTHLGGVPVKHRLTMVNNRGVPGAPANGTYWDLYHGWGPLELPVLKVSDNDRSYMMNEGYIFKYEVIPQ